MTHSGHYNAIRQAKMQGDVLVIGIISDASVFQSKGPPILKWEERSEIISACKWVDEVCEQDSYNPTMAQIDAQNCDFMTHGDDLVLAADGFDTYSPFKDAGRFKVFKRTEGISTTDIVGRLLSLSKDKERLLKNIESPMNTE